LEEIDGSLIFQLFIELMLEGIDEVGGN